MENYRMRPIKSGKNIRMSYASGQEVLDMPNLIGVQVDSYKWFLEEGLNEAFSDISPITDFTGKLSLEFVDYKLFEEDKKYSIEECKERDATYSAPLKVNVRLINNETGEINQHEVFMGDMPLMTETGTFVINGAERVIVSQLVRSPGIYYTIGRDKTGKTLYSCQVIPNRGAWLEYETDANDVFYVKVDRNRKVPVTVLIRSMGIGTDEEILSLFGDEPKIRASFEKDPSKSYEEGILELYKKLRPGEPLAVESAESLINAMFFDQRRYDLARVGRFKFNKKLSLTSRIVNFILAEDVIDPLTGEVLFAQGEIITKEAAQIIQDAAVDHVIVQTEMANVKVLSNMMVHIEPWIEDRLPGVTAEELGITELVYYPVLAQLLEEYDDEEELKEAIKANITELIPKHITKEDILASINYNMHLEYEVGTDDDIDHLGNRRLRLIGELLKNQFRIGFSKLRKNIEDRMSTIEPEKATPQNLINIKPLTSSLKEFFGSSQLSQFMDQINPLAEITQKRRISALGTGGIARDRAGVEVRDVHNSHYGRMCPIETPEGPSIGLITSLASYAKIDEYGFIQTPYFPVKVDANGVKYVSNDVNEICYLTATTEEGKIIAAANTKLDAEGHIIDDKVIGRLNGETEIFNKEDIEYMDVSPQQIVSVAAACVPFLEHDDATRALMGANMQRQA
ncbi:MAG: DNA-directed RNA polymerase subunit beta, partial [Eubacterium sp.]|nr:DNA-directed RNA polymerase subunit beta [Eubacterium sp.]